MLLGFTETLQDKKQVLIGRKVRTVTAVFSLFILLPVLLYLLFHLNLIHSRSPFSSDIQEPVAKVVTPTGTGTAFLISPTLLLTARHVVEGMNIGDEVQLIFERSKSKLEVKAKIKYITPSNLKVIDGKVSDEYFLSDVAVLEVTAINEIEPLVLGESDGVNGLDEVILIGYPAGDYSITKGSINSDKFQNLNLFKLDAASNPGNSGGPLILKEDNTVIGILVGGSGSLQGENIAIKINDVKKILQNANITY